MGWAERAGLSGAAAWGYATEVHHLHRPDGYDFTRWPFKLRGTLALPTRWDRVFFAEGLLARPRYV